MLGKERASLGTVYIPSSRPAILYWQKGLLCKSTASRCLHLLDCVATQATSHRGNAPCFKSIHGHVAAVRDLR
jgi:hypothetical protein